MNSVTLRGRRSNLDPICDHQPVGHMCQCNRPICMSWQQQQQHQLKGFPTSPSTFHHTTSHYSAIKHTALSKHTTTTPTLTYFLAIDVEFVIPKSTNVSTCTGDRRIHRKLCGHKHIMILLIVLRSMESTSANLIESSNPLGVLPITNFKECHVKGCHNTIR